MAVLENKSVLVILAVFSFFIFPFSVYRHVFLLNYIQKTMGAFISFRFLYLSPAKKKKIIRIQKWGKLKKKSILARNDTGE